MNKTELIDAVAVESGLTKVDARQAVEASIKTTGEQLKEGERITIAGFGTFSVVERAAGIGRNSFTGAKLEIGKRKIIKFKAVTELSDGVQ